jgi:ATP-dependent helicase/DNAse subunit B
MAFNPNAIFLSPSSIGDFDKCLQKYYYSQIYRSPRGLKIQVTNPALALGGAVHDVLEQFLKLPKEERNENELKRIYDWTWRGISGEKGGFLSQEEENEAKERGQVMLKRFWANSHFRTAEPVKIPSFPKAELGNDLILTGKLDWIEKEGDFYHIIDFKTGKNEEKEDSQQLPIYSVLVSKILNTDKIRTSYWYLDKDEDIVSFPEADLDKTFKDLQKKGEIIKLVRQTNSYRCQSGLESCWACRDLHAVAQGKGKLVHLDPVNRKQEIYIIPPQKEEKPQEQPLSVPSFTVAEDLPF